MEFRILHKEQKKSKKKSTVCLGEEKKGLICFVELVYSVPDF